MTKLEVAQKIMQKTGMTRKQSLESLELFLKCIKEALKRGEKISLVGFGTFSVKKKNARAGRNPRSGEKINIPQKNIPIFKPGKSFKDMVNNS
jgi:DNA-binding protein HU-beta